MPGPRFHAELGLRALRSLGTTGLVAPIRPDRLARMIAAPFRAGIGPSTIVAAGAARHPDRVAVSDELGTLTYAELDARAAAEGIDEGTAEQLLLRLRERQLRRELAVADDERLPDLQQALAKVRTAFREFA